MFSLYFLLADKNARTLVRIRTKAPVDPRGKRDAITKIIVNKRTDAWKIDVILSFTITNCSVLVFEANCYLAHCFLKKRAGCMITKYTLRRHNRLWLLIPFMTEVSVERLTPALAGFLDAADTNCSCDWMLSNQNKLRENSDILSAEIKKIKQRYPYFELEIEQDTSHCCSSSQASKVLN